LDKKSLDERYKQLLVEVILQYLPKCKIYLFGSRARKTHCEGADVDLALDNNTPIEFSILNKIESDIEESTMPLLVDIVDINNAASDFVNEIKKDWILWTH